MAAVEAPPVAAAAVAAKGGTAADAVGQRREVSVAPGSRPAPEASVARPATDAVAASAIAERKEADPQPGLERQASDPGTLAGQAALRPERTLSHDAPAATPEPARDGISEQLGTPRWQQELGQRLVTLAGQGVREVRLQLHPEHLGPLEVRITLHDSQVGLWFGAQHVETRDALEQSLPRLREMFTQGGLTMADASVAQHQHDRGNQTATAPRRGLEHARSRRRCAVHRARAHWVNQTDRQAGRRVRLTLAGSPARVMAAGADDEKPTPRRRTSNAPAACAVRNRRSPGPTH